MKPDKLYENKAKKVKKQGIYEANLNGKKKEPRNIKTINDQLTGRTNYSHPENPAGLHSCPG